MGANTFGRHFCLTTYGESHGPCIGGVIDGCPAGLKLDKDWIAQRMAQRRPGQSSVTSPRVEADHVEWLSGVFDGVTLGTPIGFQIQNQDARSQDYASISTTFRPGHADYVYQKKYGIRDWRGGGRASARETAVRVAAGAIAEQVIAQAGISIVAGLIQVGDIKANNLNWETVLSNPLYCPDNTVALSMQEAITAAQSEGDSLGGRVRVVARGVPVGLGEPIYQKLEADIAAAMMGINAVKGVSIGDGFDVVCQKGSQHRDEMNAQGAFLSNHAGGVTGGISTGQDITVDIAIKPPSSIVRASKTIDHDGSEQSISVKGRHDPCVAIRAVPVAAAMLALVLCDHWLMTSGTQPFKSVGHQAK
jgi:chorismate synthase